MICKATFNCGTIRDPGSRGELKRGDSISPPFNQSGRMEELSI
jgi:hypothetical protein